MRKFLFFVHLLFFLGWGIDIHAQKLIECPYHKMVSFDSSPFKSFKLTESNVNPYYNMTFRLLYPKNYDASLVSTQSYPLILMFHGAGESALGAGTGSWPLYPEGDPRRFNNDHQLLHQGSAYISAVNNGKWPGFVLFPQNPNGFWTGHDWILDQVIEIVQALSLTHKIDPDRIYISGLSGGAFGAWDGLSRYPSVFAAANIMSGIGYATPNNTTKVSHLPISYFQGEIDNSPAKYTADQTINQIKNVGGLPKYKVYLGIGHSTWDLAIADPDYFPFLLRHSKLSIHPSYGKTEYCEGEAINTKLSVSPGFISYEWKKDDLLIPGSNNHEIVATATGNYTVRFRRFQGWSDWSAPVIIKTKAPITPMIFANGSTSLPGLDGSNSVILTAPGGKSFYKWSTGASTQNITVSTAGSYQVQTREQDGCLSKLSEPTIVTVGNGINLPISPSQLTITSPAPAILNLSWIDNSSNETGFEIYRSFSENGPFTFVALVKNVAKFSDSNLIPNTTYYYKLRAINENGASEAITGNGLTATDLIPPSIPQNLTYIASTPTQTYLSWNASSDNVAVLEYLIFVNGSEVATTSNTTYTLATTANESSVIFIKARDVAGNISGRSNQITCYGIHKGLKYSYYEKVVDKLPDFNTLSPIKTGYLSNFSITPRESEDYFLFRYEGFIEIKTAGTYTFYTSSDDGSILYLNGTKVVDNDGVHSSRERSGTINLSAGFYPIQVNYFDKIGSNSLVVRYLIPGTTAAIVIPDAALVSANPNLPLPVDPSNLTVTATPGAFNRLTLNWQDNSTNESAFEIYRSPINNKNFELIAVVGMNVSSYIDNTLSPATRYFYKTKAINDNGSSDFSIEASNTTPSSTTKPAAPLSPKAIAISTTAIEVSWVDNSTIETLYEVQRATSLTGTYTTVFIGPANATSFVDKNLTISTTYFYRIRSGSNSAYSTFTSIVSASATNPPILLSIGNKTVPEGSRNTFTISATEPDNETVTFSASNLPAFASLINSNYNTAKLVVVPGYEDSKIYNNIIITATDTKGASTSETISISVTNVNRAPKLSPIGNQNVNEGEILEIPLSSSDPDGTTPTLSVSSLPTFAKFINNLNGTGKIVVTAKSGHEGTYKILVRASDSNGATASETFYLKVFKLNPSIPVLNPVGNKTVDENTTNSYTISASDNDGDPISLTASGLPVFCSLTDNKNGTGTLTIAPNYNHSGVWENIKITASDNKGGISSETIAIIVNDINRAPIISTVGNQSLNEATTLTINISVNDEDGDGLSISSLNLPGFATLSVSGATATLKLSPGYSDANTYENVTITATDSKGAFSSTVFKIVVVDTPEGKQTIINRVNCGGPSETSTPVNWTADQYNPKSQYVKDASIYSNVGGSCWWPNYTNTTGAPNCIFGTFRYDWSAPVKYEFPVANGSFIVNLFFAQKEEPYTPGDHIFNVLLESKLVLENFEMYAENGFNAIKKSFSVSITDGSINIDVVGVKNSPQINGIEIISIESTNSSAARILLPAEENNKELLSVKAKPNPVNSSTTSFDLILNKTINEKVEISIWNELGLPVLIGNYKVENESFLHLDLSHINLSRGMYLIKINSRTIKNQSVKLLKE